VYTYTQFVQKYRSTRVICNKLDHRETLTEPHNRLFLFLRYQYLYLKNV